MFLLMVSTLLSVEVQTMSIDSLSEVKQNHNPKPTSLIAPTILIGIVGLHSHWLQTQDSDLRKEILKNSRIRGTIYDDVSPICAHGLRVWIKYPLALRAHTPWGVAEDISREKGLTKRTERNEGENYKPYGLQKTQNKEFLIINACYSVTKYYLCRQNNKRSLLGRKQQSQVARSFPNRYLFSYANKVTSLFFNKLYFRCYLAMRKQAFCVCCCVIASCKCMCKRNFMVFAYT